MWELVYVGFVVFYDEVLMFVYCVNILVVIKNINNLYYFGILIIIFCKVKYVFVVGIVSD